MIKFLIPLAAAASAVAIAAPASAQWSQQPYAYGQHNPYQQPYGYAYGYRAQAQAMQARINRMQRDIRHLAQRRMISRTSIAACCRIRASSSGASAATPVTAAASARLKCTTCSSACSGWSIRSLGTSATAASGATAGKATSLAHRATLQRKARRRNPARLFYFRASGYRRGGRLLPARKPAYPKRTARHGHHPAHARLPALRGAAGARRGALPLRRGRRDISRFRGRDRGQPARPRPPASDQGDPGPGGAADARLQPLRKPAGRGLRAAAGRPDLRRHGVLHQFGRRGGGMRDQGGAALPSRQGQPAQARPHHFLQRLPRADDGDDQRHRPGQAARRLRAAAAGLQGGRVRQPRGGAGRDRRP